MSFGTASETRRSYFAWFLVAISVWGLPRLSVVRSRSQPVSRTLASIWLRCTALKSHCRRAGSSRKVPNWRQLGHLHLRGLDRAQSGGASSGGAIRSLQMVESRLPEASDCRPGGALLLPRQGQSGRKHGVSSSYLLGQASTCSTRGKLRIDAARCRQKVDDETGCHHGRRSRPRSVLRQVFRARKALDQRGPDLRSVPGGTGGCRGAEHQQLAAGVQMSRCVAPDDADQQVGGPRRGKERGGTPGSPRCRTP